MFLVVKLDVKTKTLKEAICSFSLKEHAIQYIIDTFGEEALNKEYEVRYIEHYH